MKELLNKRVLSLILFIHTLFFMFLLFFVYNSYKESKLNLLKEAYEKDYRIINEQIKFISKEADIVYYLLINERVRTILSLKNKQLARKLLYEELKDEYERIKNFFHILHFQYRCYSFLRFYDESKYGDFLGKFRKSICYVMKTHKVYRGFEVGQYGVFYRNVYPIDKDMTVEISVDFFDLLNKIFDDVYLLLDKKYTSINIEKFAYPVNGDLYSYKCHFHNIIDINKKIFGDYFIYNVSKGIYIVLKYNSVALKELENYYVKLLATIVIMYILIFLVIVLIYKYLIRRVEATIDPLTGLLNRNGCKARLFGIGDYSLLVIDIDFFKKVNDTYGHDVGDEVLKGVGEVIKNTLRKTDIVCRWGGEEFIVILPYTELEDAVKVAENLRKKIKNSKFANINVTVSIGVSKFIGSFDYTFKRADENLYKAKKSGRDRVIA